MVELALAFMVFALLVFGGIDAGRAIYTLQGLTRASEAIAHATALQFSVTYSADSTSSMGVTSQSMVTSFVSGLSSPFQQGSAASNISFDLSEPTQVTNQVGYQVLSNRDVSICGTPSLSAPQVLKVTVHTSFTPVTSFLIGGKRISLSRSATVLTTLGEENGSVAAALQNVCP